MSPVSLFLIGLLLFSTTNGDEAQHKDVPRRSKRSVFNMYKMFNEVTGYDGLELLNYGNFCGFGGNGDAVDSLDACCQSHDICYSEIQETTCRDLGLNAVYRNNYKWVKNDNDKPTCGDNGNDLCKSTLCLCDVVLVKCLQDNLKYFNLKHQHKISLAEAMREVQNINNLKEVEMQKID